MAKPCFSASIRLLAIGLLMAACSTRPGPEVLTPQTESSSGGKIVTVFVATTRARAVGSADQFTSGRASEMSFSEYDISIPPDHLSGEIEWPTASDFDPARNFMVVRHNQIDRGTFERRMAHSMRKGHGGGIFVHGYNTSYQEGLFRLAQMSADSNVNGAPVLFSWPSEARLMDYATDKEAATYSRDGLADLLRSMTRLSGGERVALFAHSMGGWLTMEALRQLRLQGSHAVIDRLDVILAAPDIDNDVFRAQLRVIGPLEPPLVILVSPDDRALKASRILQGSRPRIGALDINDPMVQSESARAGVIVVDVSTIAPIDGLNHSRYVRLASLYPKLAAQAGSDGLLNAGAFVLNAVGTTLAAPFNAAGNILEN